MNNQYGSFASILISFLLVYMAYSYLGPVGGIISLLLVLAFLVWKNRSIIYQNSANKKYLNGDFNGALNDLNKAVSLAPKSSGVRGTYAYLLLKLGRTEEASAQIDEALKTALPSDKNLLIQTKALILWKQGRIDEAISEMEDLLKVYENTNVYVVLGLLYLKKGDYDKALEFNLQAEDFNGSNAMILDNLGASYYFKGEYEKANEIYERVMKLKPVFPEAFYNYARVLDKLGDTEKAIEMAKHALTLKFWHISAADKEEVELFLEELKKRTADTDTQGNKENTDKESPEQTETK